ncbi:PH domain leucine-rich repeat-containing protein phosphatase 2-like isoform X1 [Mytilus californianus]|uniref:PH domain leucine-rich repeat-containing protein phosphatase 2-like isoform X1 n=1 Tax=Mytilus californianus TaxID=6549 RepID=UPI00224622D5|nr:PH domain leucine-rich repeat-containing protein phosphatase 2-like isoform X1 [Mytilus californianus]
MLKMYVPEYNKIILPFPRTINPPPEGGTEDSSSSRVSFDSCAPSQISAQSHATTRADDPLYHGDFNGADAWWTVDTYLRGGLHHGKGPRNKNEEDTWDLSDSLADLYVEANKRDKSFSDGTLTMGINADDIDRSWLDKDTSNGYIRVFFSDADNSQLSKLTLSTQSQKICTQCGRPPNSLHVQLNGDIIKRLEPFDCPLAIQNEYLQRIGYTDISKIQEFGASEDLSYLVKFYAGKPISDSTYSRNQLQSLVLVRKGKLIYQWVKRLCVISGTRLMIYRDKNKNSKPTIVQLAKGSVEESQFKGHEFCLKLTSTLQGDRSVYLSFTDENEFSKWFRKSKKATAKLPSKADLSNCHLEFLPETVFINEDLQSLNLRHNALKSRPIEEDIYTIGWLDDLPRFHSLTSLNLADNNLLILPSSLCKLKTLTELNIASNQISILPPDLAELSSLQVLQAHNNHLTALPLEMWGMKSLHVLVLAFNHFTTVPEVLLNSQHAALQLDSIIMAGNRIEKLTYEVLSKMQHIKKVDFRMNLLSLLPSETIKFSFLEILTHLDVRDNQIPDLDIRSLKGLEYLNCERNEMHTLQINGMSLKNVLASHNKLETFSINPKPEWIVNIEISHNKLKTLPSWMSECFFLLKLDISYNQLTKLPGRLFVEAQKLKVLRANHNQIHTFPEDIGKTVIEELNLEHNKIESIPAELFIKASKLRYLNLTGNNLEDLPELPPTNSPYRLTELYLSFNHLDDLALTFVCTFSRLKVLHLAHNYITELRNRDIVKLDTLQELNLSGNKLRHLPVAVGKHPKLQVLRINANFIKDLPDFKRAQGLKVLEVGSNRLSDITVANLMSSQVNLLDISGNNINLDTSVLKGISTVKKICSIDMRGQNRSLLDLRQSVFDNSGLPWQTGLSQTSGTRNKLSVSIINKPSFTNEVEGLFGIFDGGRNDEVVKVITDNVDKTLLGEIHHQTTHYSYMKYTMLALHSKLKSVGQKVGAAGVLCHIRKSEADDKFVLNIANVGDTMAVISRHGEAVPLSRLFVVNKDKEERQRIYKSDGIITEDGHVSGVTCNSRLLGCSFLFPHVVPEPHVTSINLRPEDQVLIIANHGLWKYVSYQEAVNQVINIPDPVLGAKKLQDLAQGYGSKESIGVLVVRLLLSNKERHRMKDILQTQFEAEQNLLSQLKSRDLKREMEKRKRRSEMMEEEEVVPMEIVKLKDRHRTRVQASSVFSDEGGEYVSLKDVRDQNESINQNDGSGQNGDFSDNWEELLQKRLTEEIKNKELQHAFLERGEGQSFMFVDELEDDIDNNWEISDSDKDLLLPKNCKGSKNNFLGSSPLINPSASVQSIEFQKEYNYPMNIDRDAILFHQMQMVRATRQSTDSLNSTQSVPANPMRKDFSGGLKTSSHSIEVLIHSQEPAPSAHSIGGSEPEPNPSYQGNPHLHNDQVLLQMEAVPQNSPLLKTKQKSKHSKKDKTSVQKETKTTAAIENSSIHSQNDRHVLNGKQDISVTKKGNYSPEINAHRLQHQHRENIGDQVVQVHDFDHDYNSRSQGVKVKRSPPVTQKLPQTTHRSPPNRVKNLLNGPTEQGEMTDICDTSVVSGYKQVKNFSEKKHRAPPAPVAIPQILERSDSDVTNIRATSGIPAILKNSQNSIHMSCGVYEDVQQFDSQKHHDNQNLADGNISNRGSLELPHSPVNVKEMTQRYIDTINANQKSHVTDDMPVPKHVNTIAVLPLSPKQKPKHLKQKMYKVETDYNANSISSLEGIYHLIGSSKSKTEAPLQTTPKPLTRSRSLESLIGRSISQQSITVTYL